MNTDKTGRPPVASALFVFIRVHLWFGSMVVPARPVGVAVGEFIGGGVADGDDLDVEVKGLAGQGVVGVDGDVVVTVTPSQREAAQP